MITVCSGFAPLGYVGYGKKFIETFDRYWPAAVYDLRVYGEEPVEMPRGEYRDLWSCYGASEFYARHRDNPKRSGRAPVAGWRQKDHKEGYSWRFDALKFFKQCLIPYNVSCELVQNSVLVWLDADVVTFDYVPEDFIDKLLDGADLAYLGRGTYHSEIGFWAIRITKAGRGMLRELADLYVTDAILKLGEHHSAFAFDYARKRAQENGLRAKNLTPGGGGHCWIESPLSAYMDHLKGPRRKALGRTPKGERKKQDGNPYWS